MEHNMKKPEKKSQLKQGKDVTAGLTREVTEWPVPSPWDTGRCKLEQWFYSHPVDSG